MIGYIYYILDLTNADMYIGSTWKHGWNDRKKKHRAMKDIGCASTKIIKNNNYIFEILEENDYLNITERYKKEQYYIDNNKCINKNRAYRGDEYKKEYENKLSKDRYLNDIDYKNRKIQSAKKQYENNKDKINNFRKRRICCLKCKKELSFSAFKRHNNTYH